jgi:hypothetical protein
VTTEKYAHTAEESKEIIRHLAYHEAGHAVVCTHFDHPFSRIWIMPESELKLKGLRDLRGQGDNGGLEMTEFERELNEVEEFGYQDWIADAAGIQAEMLVLGKTLETDQRSYSDRQKLGDHQFFYRHSKMSPEERKQSYIFDPEGTVEAPSNFVPPILEKFDAFGKADGILKLPNENAALHSLAKALMQKFELSGDEAMKVMEDARASVES